MLKLNMTNSNNDLATKQFVKDTVEKAEKKLSKRIDGVDGRINSLENKVDKLEENLTSQIDQVRNDIDGLAKLVKNSIDEKLIQRYRQEQLEEKVDKNTKRITKLEKQSANA